MASKLSVYNGVNLVLGERKLRSLAETRPSRRRLDTWWDGDGIKECLQEGLWNFAMRTVSLTYSPSVAVEFGYQFAFDKPTDWVRTALLSDDECFANIRTDYIDEGEYIQANCETIYLKYVSDDVAYGMDLSRWPPKFTEFVQQAGADKLCIATTNSPDRKEQLAKDRKKALNVARSLDAMDEAPKNVPAGSWSRARRGNGPSSNDRGNPGRLIG